jgi:hypothetical protein
MNYVGNPLKDLHEAMAHAQYEGFGDIEYETRDWDEYRKTKKDVRIPAQRRPHSDRDFNVHVMFPQTWGSTALGHGGMGGAAVTTAYSIVLYCRSTDEFLVYFGGEFCYRVNRKSANIGVFMEDVKNQCLASKKESERYQ